VYLADFGVVRVFGDLGLALFKHIACELLFDTQPWFTVVEQVGEQWR